jgi:hypothetical protein
MDTVDAAKYPGGSLVFVWNAQAGVLNALRDSLHKWISPDTYPCKLCLLTHGFAAEKHRWREFLQALDRPVYFYYRDRFEATGIRVDPAPGAPAVLQRVDDKWHVVLGPSDLDRITSLQELIERLREELGRG